MLVSTRWLARRRGIDPDVLVLEQSSRYLRVIRVTVMFFLVLDSTDLIASALSPEQYGPLRWTAVLTVALSLLACGLVLWQKWLAAAIIAVPVLVLTSVSGALGPDFRLVLVVAAVTGATLPLRRLWISVMVCGILAVILAVARSPQEQVRVGLTVFALAVGVMMMGALGRRLWTEDRERQRMLAVARAETSQIRRRERQRIAAELQQSFAESFTSMQSSIASDARLATTEELRAQIVRAGVDARSVLDSYRLALSTLRAELEPTSPEPTQWWLQRVASQRPRAWSFAAGFAASVVAAMSTAADGYPTVVVALAAPVPTAICSVSRFYGRSAAAVVLLAGLTAPTPTPWLALPAGLLAFLAASGSSRREAAFTFIGVVGYVLALAILFGHSGVTTAVLVSSGSFVGVLAGVTVGHFESARSRWESQHAQVGQDRSRALSEDQRFIARELHDGLARQLSLISLQALSAEGESDPAELRIRVARIRTAIRSAEDEVREIVEALRVSAADAAPMPAAMPAVMVSEELKEQLTRHGLVAEVEVPGSIDELEPTLRVTASRILQEVGTNAIRYAHPGKRCLVRATVSESEAVIDARNFLGIDSDRSLSAGYGLRGIRERVDLLGGSFQAGPDQGEWVVRVVLPIGSGRGG